MEPPAENQGQSGYIFETETRTLKAYYSSHADELVNKRIIFNNSTGTVRYIGGLLHEGKPANSEKELWVGLEWDEAGRGKHDGTVSGHCYFCCEANRGSMVKY